LQDDATRLVEQAKTSGILPNDAESTVANRAIAQRVCAGAVR
jgi:hypothetical protein